MGPKQRAALISVLEMAEDYGKEMADAGHLARDSRDTATADFAREAEYRLSDIACALRGILFGNAVHREKATEQLAAVLIDKERRQIEMHADVRVEAAREDARAQLQAEIARRFGAPVKVWRRALEL